MTPLQKLELRMSDLRRELAAALEAAEPDAETVQRLTNELRAADTNLNQSQGEMRRWWGANDGAGSFSKYG